MQALFLEQQEGRTVANIAHISESLLPPGDIIVDIEYSSLNYKDALAITGTGKIIRNFPMVPGIDFAGRVRESQNPRYKVGQSVLLTGWGVGETHWGGLADTAQVKADWLVPMPENIDARKAMIIGTAGFTAMLCVMALEDAGISPENGPIAVSGASGGVGSTAVTLLHQLGYQVSAISSRQKTHEYLKSLGAENILDSTSFEGSRPLEKQVFSGGIDTVGGSLLAGILARINYGGCVAACGMAGDITLPTSVMPFILRNVRLQGVDSVMVNVERRLQAWQRLAELLPQSFYQQATTEISLSEAPEYAEAIINHTSQGRTLVKIR